MRNYIAKRRAEKGSADIVVILLTLPLVVFLLLSLIDISLYFQARTQVQNVARDGARQVAIWGGNNSVLNPTTQTVSQSVMGGLWDGDGCTASACERAPVVTCAPNTTARAGQEVYCEVTYYYTSLVPGNPITGFGDITENGFTIREYARAETGFA